LRGGLIVADLVTRRSATRNLSAKPASDARRARLHERPGRRLSREIPLGADIQLIDLEDGTISVQSTSNPGNGDYLVSIPTGKNYALNVSAKGYLFHSENFSLKNYTDEKPFLINVALEPIKVGNTVVLKNIFFEIKSSAFL
jgi:hypothetical protein